ncbi:NfeD family protein [Breoghania sp.]|uniref:NfeD family protein n=1 Tax=Breoghania sp. TaxID=2065378 RepID=UPI0032047A8B
MNSKRAAGDDDDDPALNRRGAHYVGREFVLGEPIAQGVDRLHVDDTVWRISGPDLPAGAKVRVVEVDGSVLKVAASEG